MLIFLLHRSHEDMSIQMVDHIVDEHNIDVDQEMIKRVKVSCDYYSVTPLEHRRK